MNIEELSKKLVNQISSEIGPVLKKACEKSKKFPCYIGLDFDISLPIYEKEGNLWYGIVVNMRWLPPLPAEYALMNLFCFYLPIGSEKILFWSTNRTKLNRGNIDTFVKSKIGKFIKLLSDEQNWSISHDFKIAPVSKILTTKESRSIIESIQIESSLFL